MNDGQPSQLNYSGVRMFRRINLVVRKAVALCLAVAILCQTALAEQCVCSPCPTTGSSSCACCYDQGDTHNTVGCSECSAICCPVSSDDGSIPSQPCSCQCHQAPFGVVPLPSDIWAGLYELIDHADFYVPYWPIVPKPSSLRLLRFHRANDSWSPLETCILLCRFLT